MSRVERLILRAAVCIGYGVAAAAAACVIIAGGVIVIENDLLPWVIAFGVAVAIVAFFYDMITEPPAAP